MPSLFAGKATNETATTVEGPVDWSARKSEILSRLDLVAEYEALGVRFVRRTPDARGRLECHSVERPDECPSAVVFLPSGRYHDSGGGGVDLSFWDFALRYGNHGEYADVLRHYMDRAGVSFGKVSKSRNRVLERRYDYRDEFGDVRYAVFRYVLPNGKKTFTQHPPDGKGGWKYGAGCMDGVVPLPYRLPELLDDDGDSWVFAVEGEKAAEALASLGLLATTSHGGASNTDKTWPRFLEHFRGRTVHVLPDNDAGGRTHARKVCGHLRGIARSVRLVELPDLPPKGDVVDWLADGGTGESLLKIAAACPEWEPGVAETEAPTSGTEPVDDGLPPDEDVQTICLADVVEVPVDWLWPDRVPLGKLTLLAGEAKLGKSFLTMDFIARVSAGLEIPGSPGELMPLGSVVLLSAEDDLADTVKPRLVACGADFAKVHALTTIRLPNGQLGPFNLSYVPHLERAVLRTGDCKLVVIDPVPHYVGNGTDDHKNAQTRQLLEPLKDMANRLRIAVLMVTHLNKGTGTKALNRVTGSGAYTALARANWMVIKDKDDPKRRLFLSAGTNLVEEPSGLAYRIGRESKRVEWEEGPVLMTADDALAASMEARKEEDRQARPKKAEQAQDWLAAQFTTQLPLLSDDVFARAIAAGFTKDAMYKAKAALGIKARPWSEGDRRWGWWPPSTEHQKTRSHEVTNTDSEHLF